MSKEFELTMKNLDDRMKKIEQEVADFKNKTKYWLSDRIERYSAIFVLFTISIVVFLIHKWIVL